MSNRVVMRVYGESRRARFLKVSHFCSQISKLTAMENSNQRKTPLFAEVSVRNEDTRATRTNMREGPDSRISS